MVLWVVYYLRITLRPGFVYEYDSGDAYMYNALAQSLVRGEGFSNLIFGLRPPTPVLPLAAVYALAGYQPELAVFYNAAWGALTCVLTLKVAVMLLPERRAALAAALLLAIEVAFVDANTTMFSEPVHNLLMMVGLYFVVRLLRGGPWHLAFGAGLGVGGALLSRAISANFLFVFVILVLLYPHPLRHWRAALTILAVGAACYGLWIGRNYYYVGNPNLSTTGAFTLLFYRSVAAEHNATGRDPDDIAIKLKLELESRLGVDLTEADIAAIKDYPVGRDEDLYANDPRRQVESKAMAQERLLRYPFWSAALTPVYLARQFDANSALMLPRAVQFVLTGSLLLLALAGYFEAWREALRSRRWDFLLLSHLVIGYYAGVVAVAVAGLWHVRYRTPYLPFVVMYSGWGLILIWDRIKHALPAETDRGRIA